MGKLVLGLAAFALVLGACSQAATTAGAPATVGRTEVGSGFSTDASSKGGAPLTVAPQEGIPAVVVNADRNLILTAKIDMRTKDPWATSQTVQQLAGSLGGDVLNVNESMDGRLSEAFGALPKTGYEVKPLEAYREKDAPAAYYLPPAIDGVIEKAMAREKVANALPSLA